MKIVSPLRFGIFIGVIVLVVLLIVGGVALKMGWLHNPFSKSGGQASMSVSQDDGKATTETLQTLNKAEVVMKDDTSVVVRFTGSNTVVIDGKTIQVQEAATVFYRPDTKFQGTSKDAIAPGDTITLETKRIDSDGSARFEALKISK